MRKRLKMRKSPLLTALFIILLASSALSISYYADVALDVSSSGQVKISGTTNHPMLASGDYDAYTSKSGSIWLLNISINDSFSDYIYSAELPPYASVNYIKASSPVRIEEDSQRIIIIGTGKSQPLSIIVQYEIKEKKASANPAIIFLLIAVLGALIYFWASNASNKSHKIIAPKKSYNESALTERQKQIVRLIERKGGSSTQNVLEKELSIPKASLSRNLETLSKKGIIKKESRGMSNVVYFPHKDEKSEAGSDSKSDSNSNSDSNFDSNSDSKHNPKKKIKYWN